MICKCINANTDKIARSAAKVLFGYTPSIRKMSRTDIKTFVFLDLETTGLPAFENYQTKITEFSMIAIESDQLSLGVVPRVQNKLKLCFNPQKLISDGSEKITGLSNFLLEHMPSFKSETVALINSFLKQYPQPVCLVAHNGYRFDYPILQAQIQKTNSSLVDSYCIDTLEVFRELERSALLAASGVLYESTSDETDNVRIDTDMVALAVASNGTPTCSKTNIYQTPPKSTVMNTNSVPLEFMDGFDELLCNIAIAAENNDCQVSRMQKINETTPVKQKVKSFAEFRDHSYTYQVKKPKVNHVRTRLKFQGGFKLGDVYKRYTGAEPLNAHDAEGDVNMLITCAATFGQKFVDWANQNAKKFSDISPMMPRGPIRM